MNFLSGVTEFNYMTQLVLMVYEDSSHSNGNEDSKDRFHIELLFSPGLYPCFQTEKERIYETRTKQKLQHQSQTPIITTNSIEKTGSMKSKTSSGDTNERVSFYNSIHSTKKILSILVCRNRRNRSPK